MSESLVMSEKEKRVRAITRLYYSNPKVQQALLDFAKDREVAPRYFEAFGKRPDTLQYQSDIMGLVNKGATSFHASEEIWYNPLEINSEMSHDEMQKARKGWDLLIDIDSPFLDYSKIAATLLLDELEKHGINCYGVKFSGSKGFHIIVPNKAFPEFHRGIETKSMFPDWARAIVEYLMMRIRPEYNKRVTELGINFEAVKERMNLSHEDLISVNCPNCSQPVTKTNFVHFECERCHTPYSRPNFKVTKKKLKCTDYSCPGFMEVKKEEDYFFCSSCKTKLQVSNSTESNSSYRSTTTIGSKDSKSAQVASEFKEELAGEKIASLDLVLVAPRHLFRMPYSLHEKTSLSSVVLDKKEIPTFSPHDANPLKLNIKPFYINPLTVEAQDLLESAVSWKISIDGDKPQFKKLSEDFVADFTGVTESMFPDSIKRLLKGLQEGRKRGLFVLMTFLKCLNFPDDYINQRVREWNEKNTPPLKEGYIKAQLDWNSKQKKKILPPNYANDNFYKDLKLIDVNPSAKNPLVEVLRNMNKSKTEYKN
ncbi:MAG: hypothetical protein ACP5NS_04700 [Candidatus Pacearchaeota archaeon]